MRWLYMAAPSGALWYQLNAGKPLHIYLQNPAVGPSGARGLLAPHSPEPVHVWQQDDQVQQVQSPDSGQRSPVTVASGKLGHSTSKANSHQHSVKDAPAVLQHSISSERSSVPRWNRRTGRCSLGSGSTC